VVPQGTVRTHPLFEDWHTAVVTGSGSITGLDFANFNLLPSNTLSSHHYVINGTTTVNDLTDRVSQGDKVEVFFTVAPGQSNVPVSLVSYTAPEPYFNASTASLQRIFEQASGVFSAGTHSLTVIVPDSYFQIDFVRGPAIDRLGPAGSNIFYTPQGRLIDADNGGTAAPVPDPSRIDGVVFLDGDNDGVRDANEPGLGGVTVRVAGTNSQGQSVNLTRTTRADGSYTFSNLRPGSYTVTQTQPAGYSDGLDARDGVVLAGSAGTDSVAVQLTASSARTVTFGERQGNVAPQILTLTTNAECCGEVGEGEQVTVSGTFRDLNVTDTHTAIIYWGDGTSSSATISESNGLGSLSASHSYAQGGSYQVTVILTDSQQAQTEGDTEAVITGARIHDGILEIVGTESDDHVTINQFGSGQLKVHADFFPEGNYRVFNTAGLQRIVVRLCDGNDHATVSNGVSLRSWMFGGDGDDALSGGDGHDVLVGGAGSDMLLGGDGRDLLLGGFGADRLIGNGSDDILIAGYTSFDEDETALTAIMNEWTSARSYTERVANLQGCGSGQAWANRLNGNIYLQVDGANATVHDDAAKDKLTGSSGRDWFFANLSGGVKDTLTDAAGNEITQDED
jgi:Ca2+-binding RTX toxin-like protein